MKADNLLPRIDLLRCTGCGRCVDNCPTQALAQVEDKAALVAPAQCVLCDVCEAICPEEAIALPFLVCFAPANGDAGASAGIASTHHRTERQTDSTSLRGTKATP